MNLFKRVRVKSLKNRVMLILIINTAVPIILIGLISFYTTFNIFQKNKEIAISGEVSKVIAMIDNILDNMRSVSQHLVMEGSIGESIADYFKATKQMARLLALEQLNRQVVFFEISNPNISNITYYYTADSGQNIKLSSSLAKAQIPSEDPLLSQNGELFFYGPHPSHSVAGKYTAISMIRKIPLPDMPDTYIYMESGYKKLNQVLTQKLTDLQAIYAILSTEGDVVYSSNSSVVAPGTYMGALYKRMAIGRQSYFTFDDHSQYGWRLAILVPSSQYFEEISNWMLIYVLIFITALLASILIAVWIWRMVYLPVRQFSQQLKGVTQENIKSQVESINVMELDEDLEIFARMKERIVTLIQDVEQEEKEKNKLETKQLYYKINPHFLHNTLDTLKWFVRSRGYGEVEDFLSALNKLLLYNMEKTKVTTLNSEIAAVKDYLLLQSIKYDFEFKLNLDILPDMLNAKLPRFVLQPLVENAINHGLEGTGTIELSVATLKNGCICIEVSDNGFGISKEKIDLIMNESQDVSRNGIGLQYVRQSLKNEFEGAEKFEIISEEKINTKIRIVVPYIRSELNDQGSGS